ncbi:aldehyde dehydrogenase family protein [Paenibacillus sp. Soil750]|uniref:aldehyde dehydrogenase family protein n=1 Tax=Paenibacillus sp. Soil750 TaxID=1736398 RepID=UPI0009EC3C57|nr:aldehyde dehydrogenase family protein [Paenibacillus sp. Soil750]
MSGKVMHAGSIIDGQELKGGSRQTKEVRNPYSGEVVGKIDYVEDGDLDRAIATAERVFHETMRHIPAYQRSAILRKTADLLEARSEEFARTLVLEAGKPIRDARGEVGRAVQVLRFASDEAKALGGELVPMDAAVGGENRIGMVRRYPLGVVAAITPFNFPLNLVLHKLAPAFAAGNTVVLKPADKTPLSSIALAHLFAEAGLPKGALNVVLGRGSTIGEPLVTDPRIAKVSFTGSVPIGLQIQKWAGLKKLTLELGSNSPNLIFDDADLDAATAGLVRGAFAFSGQACISVQRIYVQSSVYNDFLVKFVKLVKQLQVGDPMLESTDIGPMISEDEAKRAEAWVREAELDGAAILRGGRRNGTVMEPTVLANVKSNMKVVCQEVFAPIVSIIPFETEEEAVRMANDSDFGLQAGVFTNNINRALRLADQLVTGGVWINEISTYRQDNHPYGGVKLSGIGKEGVKYAIQDMMESKFIGIHIR